MLFKILISSCDLLENLYLCGIYNNIEVSLSYSRCVVICLKICTFVVSITTLLWQVSTIRSCDLLENLYLCGIYNNFLWWKGTWSYVVICLKICTFVVSITTSLNASSFASCCDLLENLYLCGIYNNTVLETKEVFIVVICLKICTFVVSITTLERVNFWVSCCDLLENLYLCGIYNNIDS